MSETSKKTISSLEEKYNFSRRPKEKKAEIANTSKREIRVPKRVNREVNLLNLTGEVLKKGKKIIDDAVKETMLLPGKSGELLIKENLKKAKELTKENYENWRKASSLEEKEKHLKEASGKIFNVLGIQYKSVYLGLYMAPEDVREYYLKEKHRCEKCKDIVLNFNKLPNEYQKIMNLFEVKIGFAIGLEKIGESIVEDIKKMNRRNEILIEGDKYNGRKEEINLENSGSFEWGTTHVRMKDISGKVYKENGGYRVDITYTPVMTDSFEDAKDIFNFDRNVKQELINGKAFNMEMEKAPKRIQFSVKNIKEIPGKMAEGYSKLNISEKIEKDARMVKKKIKEAIFSR